MQMEQINEQKRMSFYKQEHSNSFRNVLRNKFIQKSREKHSKSNINNQQQKQYEQGDQLYINNQNHLFENRSNESNLLLISSLQNDNPLLKFNQDEIIEDIHYENDMKNYNSNANISQFTQNIDINQMSVQFIQQMNFQQCLQVLQVSSLNLNTKLLLLQHITDLIENNLQDLMKFSYFLQNNINFLDIIKDYIEQNQQTYSSIGSNISNPDIRPYDQKIGQENFYSSQSYSLNEFEGSQYSSKSEFEVIDQQNNQENRLMWAINLISLIAYTKQENVVTLINKGFVDVYMNMFMEFNQNIKIAEKIISFFANVISVNDMMKTIILNSIPIKLFLFYFINNRYHSPVFLDFHQILALFLNKCYIQSNVNDNENTQDDLTIMQSLAFIFNSVINDFISAFSYFYQDSSVSINLSEILTSIFSNILKTYPLQMIKQHINQVQQLIQLQIQSGFKPLLLQSIKLISKIFQIPNLFKEIDDQTKDSLNCEIKQIKINSITAISDLLKNLQDEQQYSNIIEYLYLSIFSCFENDNLQIKLICLNLFGDIINYCSTNQFASAEWKIKMSDQILASLIQQLNISNFQSLNNQQLEFVQKILNILSPIIYIIHTNSYQHKLQQNYLSNRGLLEILNFLQNQDTYFEIKNKANQVTQMLLQTQTQTVA